MGRRRTSSSTGCLEFSFANRQRPFHPAWNEPPGVAVVAPVKRCQPQFTVDDMKVQALPILPAIDLYPPSPSTDILDFGFFYTEDRRVPDPRQTQSVPSSIHGSPRRMPGLWCVGDTAANNNPAAQETTAESFPPQPFQYLTPVPLPTSEQDEAAAEHANRLPGNTVVRLPTPPHIVSSTAASVAPLADSRASSAHISSLKAVIHCEPTPCPSTALFPSQASLPTPPVTALPSSPLPVPSPVTVPTTICSSFATLPSTGTFTPSTSVPPTPAMKSASHPTPQTAVPTASKTPAPALKPSMATLKADGTCRKPRGKLDHDRQRREAQEAEVEARIANRQASRKRKKEKREAKREAKLAARAANSGLLNSHADLLEASEPAKGAEAGEEVGSAQEAEPAENEEDTKPRTEANNIGTPDGLFMSTGLEVGEDPSEGLIPAVLKLGKGTNMALDSTQDGIDNLITSVCQSTAYGKLLHVSDIHATEELSGGQGSGVVAHLESHLGRNSSELLPTTPPEEKSKKKKKKARNDKRKVEPTAEALPPQLFIGKAPVHLQFDDDDDEDIVEALLDIGTLAGPADSEPAVDLVLIGVDPIDLNNQVSSGPEDSDPLSPFGLTAAINGEDGGSGPELLGPIQGLDHRGKQSSFTSEEFTDLGAWTPKVASNSLELILGDASTPDLATITEPIASTITVPGSKSKSKKKKKKKTATAAAAPQEASHAGSEATQPSTSVVSSKGDGGGVPMERFVRSISAGVPARLRAADPQNSEEAHPAISSNYVQAPTQTLSNEAARTPTQSCSPPSTPASSSFAEFGSMSSPPSYKQHPSWWYPWALLKHLRRLRIRALKFVVNEENARRRRYVFTSLCPLFKLEVNGCFEHLIKQQYTMGCCDQLNHAWKLLVHTVWRAEGAFCKIEGWQQVQNVPASLRRDDLPLGGPSLKVIAATREDNDDDWAKINAVLEVKLAAGEQYLSNPRTSSCDYYYVV